jgi:phage shock protein C
MGKRLYRSRTNRKIAGVCGGLGEYFGVDPVIFRIVLLALLLGAGSGVLLYVIFWIAVPEAPEGA